MKNRLINFKEFKEQILNESAVEFDKKLKKMFPSLRKDYLGYGNMVDAEDYLKYDYATIGGGDIDLRAIIKDLEKGGVSLKDIEIGALVHSDWGWEPEDLDTELHAGTLWINTVDDKLIQKIIKKYDPDEHSFYEKFDKYRLWWD